MPILPLSADLPRTGFLRLPQVLEFVPVSRATWWRNVARGRYPKGVKLSAACTAWRVEDIRKLIASLAGVDEKEGTPSLPADAVHSAPNP